MLISTSQDASSCTQTNFNFRRFLLLSYAFSILIFCTGCSTASTWFQSQLSAPDIELSILQVEPTTRPGVYSVSGNTTLPEQSQITIAAIRLLDDEQSTVNASHETTYEILDRKFTTVEQGQWNSNLNLWRISSDGNFQEAWQITQQRLATNFEPSPEVTFSATFDPVQQSIDFQKAIEEGNNLARPSLAQYNSDGELYLQTSRTLTIVLPTGSTAPPETPSAFVKVINRQAESQVAATSSSDIVSNSSAAQSRSDAPLSPRNFLR